MKFDSKPFTVLELFRMRNKIDYPIYQRTDDVWDIEKRRLLIDSILRGLDIPKLYYFDNGDGTFDVIDGHQRTQTLMLFLSNEFALADKHYFKNLTIAEKKTIEDYILTISIITEASDDDLRELFLRLQLGVPTNSAERLKAIKSKMGDFVEKIAMCPFIQKTNVTRRRSGKIQLCAQICINSISRANSGQFSNAKYEDLRDFYRENPNFDFNSEDALRITDTLQKMDEIFGTEASYFSSRANTVSAYLLVEELKIGGDLNVNEVKGFFLSFFTELREEVRKGIKAKNEILLNYYSRIIQAADTRTSIEARHRIIENLYDYYAQSKRIKFQSV